MNKKINELIAEYRDDFAYCSLDCFEIEEKLKEFAEEIIKIQQSTGK